MIRYRSAVKALDNIEEIAPGRGIRSAPGIFPALEGDVVQFIRADTEGPNRRRPARLGPFLPEGRGQGVLHIGVQRSSSENLSGANDDKKLFRHLLPLPLPGPRPALAHGEAMSGRYCVHEPETGTIITGKVDALSENEIRFRPPTPRPRRPSSAAGDRSTQCSLKIADRITLAPSCRIVVTGTSCPSRSPTSRTTTKQVLQEFISETE
jgi:hypothetical protein